jgi:O-antigen/teichoic acid export membrane protein
VASHFCSFIFSFKLAAKLNKCAKKIIDRNSLEVPNMHQNIRKIDIIKAGYKTAFSSLKSLIGFQRLCEIGWLVSGQAVSIILGFVSMKLLTSMGTKEFGKYSLVLTIAAFVSAVLYGPAEQGFVRFYYIFSNKGKAGTYIRIFYKFLLAAGCSFLIIALLAIPFNWLLKTSESSSGILTMGIYIIFSCSSNLFNSMLNLLRKRKANTVLQITERVLTIVFLFLLGYSTKPTANNSLFAILVALIIVVIVKAKVLNRYIPKDILPSKAVDVKERREIIKVIVTFSIPFAIWGVTGWMQSNSERWVIAKYLSTADVGIFSIMAILANYLVAMPSSMISQFMQPIIYENISAGDDLPRQVKGKKVLKYLVITIIAVAVFSTIFSAIFGRYIILLVSNKEFVAYWYILPILCVGIGIFNIAQALINVGVVSNVPKIYLFPKIITGIFALLSNLYFISRLGIIGIAISICITSTFYLLLIIFINSRLKKSFDNIA